MIIGFVFGGRGYSISQKSFLLGCSFLILKNFGFGLQVNAAGFQNISGQVKLKKKFRSQKHTQTFIRIIPEDRPLFQTFQQGPRVQFSQKFKI